jgi:hypothetical protein
MWKILSRLTWSPKLHSSSLLLTTFPSQHFVITSFPQPHADLPLDSSTLFYSTNQYQKIQLAACCLPKASKNAQQLHIDTEDGNCKFAETSDNSQHSTRLILESQIYTLQRKPKDKKSQYSFARYFDKNAKII